MDHFCDSLDYVASWIGQRVHDWRVYSYPPGNRHRRSIDSNHPRAKAVIVIESFRLLVDSLNRLIIIGTKK